MLVVKLCIMDAGDWGAVLWNGYRNGPYLEILDCLCQLHVGEKITRFQARLGQVIKLHEVIVLQGEMDRYIREVCQRNGYRNNGPVCPAIWPVW